MIEVTQTRIERPELTGRLASRLQRGSVILVADAGFGKTTALEQALAERGGSAVWVRATRTDRDPGRLVRRLVEAIRAELPGVAEDYAERLSAAVEPVDPESVARNLAEDLERLLVEPLVVAVDDAELLEGTAAVAILDALLDGGRDQLRVAICSRRPLGLTLARLKASGRVGGVRPGRPRLLARGVRRLPAPRPRRGALGRGGRGPVRRNRGLAAGRRAGRRGGTRRRAARAGRPRRDLLVSGRGGLRPARS